MISKEQFLELKHLKSLGVPTTTISKKIGIAVPTANKWLRLDEEAFDNYLRNNTPYLEQYRAFILSILKICPQTPATNIMYRIKDQFPDFDCKKTTFFRYVKDLREQTGYIKPESREQMSVTDADYAAKVKECSNRMKALEARRDELQNTEVKYAEVRAWLDTFIEQTMKTDTLTTVDGSTMKMLVDRIIVRNEGIEVEFKCGVSIEKEYVR